MGKNETLSITVTGGDVSCDGMIANAAIGVNGGIASGGDYNYKGTDGDSSSTSASIIHDANGGSVGCLIPSLMSRTSLGEWVYGWAYNGWGIYSHGGGGAASYNKKAPGESACAIIIPLESI